MLWCYVTLYVYIYIYIYIICLFGAAQPAVPVLLLAGRVELVMPPLLLRLAEQSRG